MGPAPWHLKGVAPAARETAEEAARRSGQSVGEWLSTTILGSAGLPGRRPAPSEAKHPRPDRGLSVLNERLGALSGQIERLVHSKGRAPDRGMPDQLAAAIARLDQRLDQVIRDGRQASSDMERRVDNVDRALANLTQERLRTAFVPGGDNIDRAVAEISARQRLLDGQPEVPAAFAPPPRLPEAGGRAGPDMSGLEQQLRSITSQIETLSRPCRIDEAVAALRAELAEIGGALREAMPRRAVEALEAEVRKLAAQIAEGRAAGGAPADMAGLERALADIRDGLRELTPAENLVGFEEAVHTLSRKVDMLTASGQDAGALNQVEAAVEGLRGLVAHVASGDALAALATEVRALGDKIDRTTARPADDLLKTLEQRINSISEAIESFRGQGGSVVPPGFEALIRSLTDKIEHIQLARPDQLAIAGLEERITRLVEKLDASEARLGHLEAIERGMAELLVHLEELRAFHGAGFARPAPPAEQPPPVERLNRDVAQIKQAQTLTGRRTEDSLEAVQGTIGDVVNRLAMLESDLRTDSRTPPPTDPGGLAADFDETASLLRPTERSADAKPAAAPPAAPTRPSQSGGSPRMPIDSELPPDFPLEPGSGGPRSRSGASAADRVAASERPLRNSRGAAAPVSEGTETSNFIQAARRAAKAAALQDGDGKDDADGMSKTLGDRLKQLFVGIGVVLAVASAFRFAGIYLDPERVILSDAPPPRNEVAQLPPDLPAGARAIPVPEVAPTLEPAPPPRSLPVVVAAPLAAPAGEHAFADSPPSGAIVVDRSPHAHAAIPAGAPARSDVTGSVPAPAESPASVPEPPAPPTPVAASPANAPAGSGIGQGLLVAASGGNAAAAHEVAARYAEGRGVPQSYKDAAVWYERAAKGGLAPALFRLGTMYEKGLGVAKNPQEARRLYLAAADKQNAKAMHNLAVLYAEGIDGKADYRTAAQWFQKAAGYGIADSQYNLAILYARGIGVERNLAESYKWFALAAARGDREAAKKRDDIAGRLESQTLAQARRSVEGWAAAPQPEEATTVKAPPGGWDSVTVPTEPGKSKDRPRRQVRAANTVR